jgi:hypothetical protein
MTFGRPPTIPNEYMKLELPVNQSLEKIALATTQSMGNAVPASEGPTQSDTVCFYIATMYVPFWRLEASTDLGRQTAVLHPRRHHRPTVRVQHRRRSRAQHPHHAGAERDVGAETRVVEAPPVCPAATAALGHAGPGRRVGDVELGPRVRPTQRHHQPEVPQRPDLVAPARAERLPAQARPRLSRLVGGRRPLLPRPRREEHQDLRTVGHGDCPDRVPDQSTAGLVGGMVVFGVLQ